MCGRFEEALNAYQVAINCGISQPEEAHLNRSVILVDHLRKELDAEAELRRALQLNPKYAPAFFNLANLAEDRGRRSEAAEFYERLLEIDPECWEGLARYGSLCASTGTAPPELAGRLKAAIELEAIGAADKAALGFALGDVLDRAAKYDEAFAAYTRANFATRLAHPHRYDRRGEEALTSRIIAASQPFERSGLAASSGALLAAMLLLAVVAMLPVGGGGDFGAANPEEEALTLPSWPRVRPSMRLP